MWVLLDLNTRFSCMRSGATLEKNIGRRRTINFWRKERFVGPRLWRSQGRLSSLSLLSGRCWITFDFLRVGRWRRHIRRTPTKLFHLVRYAAEIKWLRGWVRDG